MSLSVVIPVKNDDVEVVDTIRNLLATSPKDSLEIIVCNDGSVEPSNKPKNIVFDDPTMRTVSIINYHPQRGVGYAFDRGVNSAHSTDVVLMGADVKPVEGWYEKVIEALKSNPNTLGCAVSLGDKYKHYGADLLVQMGYEDLPKNKQVPDNENFTALFQAKWRQVVKEEAPLEIPCVLGAFYWTSKEYYKKIGGWDTQVGSRYKGFKYWGSLEPMISLKSWLTGGGCVLYPAIEAKHLYGRIQRKDKGVKRAIRTEFKFWNQLWIAETMIFDDALRKRVIGFKKPELNFGIAQKYIRNSHTEVLEARKSNEERFTMTFQDFMDKFGITLK